MVDLIQWYDDLDKLKKYLIEQDPKLKKLFDTVDGTGFQLHTVIKDPYTALLGAIIGQKIAYTRAKVLRGQLYQRFPIITPTIILNGDLTFLGATPANTVRRVTEYIISNGVDLNTEAGIRSLSNVKGIGVWTIETTLLTSLKDWDLFPEGDKFLQKRMIWLYGTNCDIQSISERWRPFRSVVTWYMWRWFTQA